MMARSSSWNSVQVERAFRDAGATVRRRDWLRVDVDGQVWFEGRSPRTAMAAVSICKDKSRTVAALHAADVPAPDARRCTLETVQRVAPEIGWPVCVKPAIGSKGRSVTTGITDPDLLHWAATNASRRGRDPVLVERSVEGTHWRILVLGVAVSLVECRPWIARGDGRTSVEGLIARENRRREDTLARSFPIKVDNTVNRILAEQRLRATSVLEPGETARIAWSMNARQGAITIEHGDGAPPHVRTTAAQAIDAVPGLAHGAVDLVDDGQTAWVVDVNSNPGFGAHLHPYEGTPQPVLDALVATHRTVPA